MNVRSAQSLSRGAICSGAPNGLRMILPVRHASTALYQALQPAAPLPVDSHGQHIYVFHHIQTNQVVYSLTRAMDNNAALSQLPYNGKKSVPRALRKDLWHPMATISFLPGAGSIGLSAFQKLREYRRLHETSWDKSILHHDFKLSEGKNLRGRKLQDQKANSVADIAAVLGAVGTRKGTAIGLKSTAEGISDESARQIQIRWNDPLDAEFAKKWSGNVTHEQMDWVQNNRDPEDMNSVQREIFGRIEKHLKRKRDKLAKATEEVEEAKEVEVEVEVNTIRSSGSSIEAAKERRRLKYEASQAESRKQWLASGGVPRVLTPEEEAERQVLKEAKIASQAQQKELMAKATAETPAEMTQEQVEKRLEKERIKEERRIAYEADQAEKRAAWLSTLTPEEAARIQKMKEEKALAASQNPLTPEQQEALELKKKESARRRAARELAKRRQAKAEAGRLRNEEARVKELREKEKAWRENGGEDQYAVSRVNLRNHEEAWQAKLPTHEEMLKLGVNRSYVNAQLRRLGWEKIKPLVNQSEAPVRTEADVKAHARLDAATEELRREDPVVEAYHRKLEEEEAEQEEREAAQKRG